MAEYIVVPLRSIALKRIKKSETDLYLPMMYYLVGKRNCKRIKYYPTLTKQITTDIHQSSIHLNRSFEKGMEGYTPNG